MNIIRHHCRILVTVCLSLLLLTACSSSSTETTEAAQTFPDLPRLDGMATVQFVVNSGSITVEVDGEKAPVTAGNFVDLVQQGIYNGVSFHRVIREPEPFVVQGGDPQSRSIEGPDPRLGTGNFIDPATGAPRYIPLEIEPEDAEAPVYGKTLQSLGIQSPPALPHTRGAIAMARSANPNSASSQFYFALADLSFLDGQYAVFGYITEGMDILDTIQQGDRIQSAAVVSGMENLTLPD